jgi:RNA polymerase sigma-70 factor (ECF subfamily)
MGTSTQGLIRKEFGMGRHASDRTAPGAPDPDGRGKTAGPGLPRHADLFAPTPGSRAARLSAERSAETFDRLVEPHRAALRAYLIRNTDGDEAVADSVLKETLYRASQEPGRFPRRASAVRPWLVLTARNVLRDGERREPAGHDDRPPTAASSAGSPAPRPLKRPAGSVPATTIVAAMQELPVAHRELIIQTFYGGASLEDVAADRGVPVATVKSDLFFAMRALRTVLDQQVADRHGVQ